MNIEYIAGFFDGEGTICVMKRKVRVTIPQTNLEVLEMIKTFFGVGGITIIKSRKKHWKQAWCYYSGSNKASYKILCLLEEHLILKKEKLLIAKKILEGFLKEKEVYIKKRTEAVSMIKKGLTYRKIEALTGISRTTICNQAKKIKKQK
jgi:uncharacterized protein YerC